MSTSETRDSAVIGGEAIIDIDDADGSVSAPALATASSQSARRLSPIDDARASVAACACEEEGAGAVEAIAGERIGGERRSRERVFFFEKEGGKNSVGEK